MSRISSNCACETPSTSRAAPEPAVDCGAAFGFPPDAIVFGTVARLTAQKGIDTLVRAAAIVGAEEPRFRLVIVGRGEDEPFLPDDPSRYHIEQIHQMNRRVELQR